MKIKIPRPNSVNFWLFSGLVISFLLEILVQMAIVSDNTITKIVQYILLLSPVFLCFIQFFINKLKLKYKYRYEYELKNGLFLSFVFLISTLWFSHETGKFTSNSIDIDIPDTITRIICILILIAGSGLSVLSYKIINKIQARRA